MNQYTVLAIVFFMASILMMILSITTAAEGQVTNWLWLLAGVCFLTGGVVWFVQGIKANKKNDR